MILIFLAGGRDGWTGIDGTLRVRGPCGPKYFNFMTVNIFIPVRKVLSLFSKLTTVPDDFGFGHMKL